VVAAVKPVDQTKTTPPDGDCVAACIASILELPLATVPNFVQRESCWEDWNEWLIRRGLYLVSFSPKDWTPHGYHIIDGKSHTGDWNHVVVGLNGKMVHDPNPKRRGLRGDPEMYWVFVAVDPARSQLA
jgi:hypothetical protein